MLNDNPQGGRAPQSVQDDNVFSVEFLNNSYEDLQKLAAEYDSAGDETSKETAEIIRSIPQEVFELTYGQERVRELALFLTDHGMDQDEVMLIIESLLAQAATMTRQELDRHLNAEVRANWEEFIESGANAMQQIIMLNYIATNLLGKTFDDMFDGKITEVVELIYNGIENDIDITSRIGKLSADQLNEVEQLIETEDYELASALILDEERDEKNA